ncbi:MAG: integrase core domain-containing protein [Candidatus Thermoplasmatota archaeon]|nr:integrase core domain-containing protein [Candidatus Thermoplasmatota archaeon]
MTRGLCKDEAAEKMLENYRAYYNFTRKHSSLNSKTPAEKAGINLNLGRNRWVGLIEQSL